MADAVVARQQGDDFQARWFWLAAADLLRDGGHVERVSFETGPKSFDDVVVDYLRARAPRDHFGMPYFRDHLQCKWHVRRGTFGYEDLTDPKFSNAQSFSVLMRVLDAQRQHAPEGHGARFQLVTNWDPTDPLGRLVMSQTNSLDLERLFEGGPTSAAGKMRSCWMDHLGIDADELRLALRTLGLNTRVRSAEQIREHLNDRFEAVGLRCVPNEETAFLYDDLIRKLHAQGRKVFDRASFRDMVREEKLLAGDAPPERTVVGVRSFMHPIDPIEARTVHSLDLVPMFEGRYLKGDQDWQGTVYPSLQAFILKRAGETDHLRLVLDAHVSLAYAVGAILDVKSGKDVEVEQRFNGRRFWSPNDVEIDPSWPDLTFEETAMGEGDLAVAIGVTHDIAGNVSDHVTSRMPNVGKLLTVRPRTGALQGVVRSGSHAAFLAEAVATRIRALGRQTATHLFIAAPNGLTFFLGRHHRAIGPAIIHEWDFEGLRGGGYSVGLIVP